MLTIRANGCWDTLQELFTDWGCFLDLQLYENAINFLRWSDKNIDCQAPFFVDGEYIGHQHVNLVSLTVAFALTGLKELAAYQETHLVQFLSHTDLKALHWINFNRHIIECKTIFNEPKSII